MRGPYRPFVLQVVLLLLGVARLRPHDELPTVELDLGRVMVGTGDRDRDRQLIVRLIDVDRRGVNGRLLRHHGLAYPSPLAGCRRIKTDRAAKGGCHTLAVLLEASLKSL